MTVQELTLIILVVVAAQVAVFALIAFYRHWISYAELKDRLVGLEEQKQVSPVALLTPTVGQEWKGLREFRVQRKEVEDKNKTICSFYLIPIDGNPLPFFKPGQFLTFQLDINGRNGQSTKTVVRCYSLSDRPIPEHYRVTIKKVPSPLDAPGVPPGLASNFFHGKVHAGDTLKVKPPAGHFHLDIYETDPIVLIGSGIGVTPILSMLNATLDVASQREIRLYYGVRNSAEHIMKSHLEDLAKIHPNLHLNICYSRPGNQDIKGTDYHHSGHVDITLLRQTLLLKPYQFYICGPNRMMETLVPELDAWGVPEHQIHYEAFGPASITRHEKQRPIPAEAKTIPAGVTVAFRKKKKSCQWSRHSASLLELAEENGIAMDSGCRAGSCGSCQTTIESGEVEYNQAPDIDLEPGTCLPCISVPKSDLTLAV